MERQGRTLFVVLLLCGIVTLPGCSQPATSNPTTGVRRAAEPAPGKVVAQPARAIGILHDVDVVVVGGTSGAVAAAVAAAENGASVFLAAPRPYLGEDLCGTYRLWLEPSEEPSSPLAKAIFDEPDEARQLRNAIPFSYETNLESSPPHKDSRPPSVLNDGKWHSAPSQSVQYNGDVDIIADLGSEQFVEKVHVLVYQRNDDFEVETATVYTSRDRRRWEQVGTVRNERLGQGSFEEAAFPLSVAVGQAARYMKFAVRKTAEVERILLGEIIIEDKDDPSPDRVHRAPPTPMQVKRALDDALLEAGVRFLYGCYATDVLCDEGGRPAGIVMANASGRQAVEAKIIIDATSRAAVARMAGVPFDRYGDGWQTFQRVVVGGQPRSGERMTCRKLPTPVYVSDGRAYDAMEYTLEIPMADGSFASFAEAEQLARDKTWHPDQVDSSETLFQVPPDRMTARAHACCTWPGADKVDLGVFRPAGVERLLVLGGCADMSREAAQKFLRPVEFMRVGRRMGKAAALEALRIPAPQHVTVQGTSGTPVTTGEVRVDAAWMRARQETRRVQAPEGVVPVLGEYDVVVVGGGTGGAPAGIAAGRRGAKTLVVEYLHGLGGVGTMGLIGKYYYGYREGFTKEIDQGLADLGGEQEGRSGQGQAWNSQIKIEWYRRELRKAGADIWYGTLGCGAFVDGHQVKGVVVATPQGYGVVLAKAVIDSTGSAAIAAAAGAECTYTAGDHIAVQGTGLPPWEPGARYTNTDYTFIDDIDVTDAWRSFLVGRRKFKDRYDLGQLIDTRERRQIVGDFFLPPMDVYLDRTFPDAVVRASSNFDSHGFTIHPMFMLKPPDREAVPCYVPYRCLLPAGLEGVLVTGLAVSAHRDVMPVIRMQADIQNQGYAVGVAAAMATASGQALRDIDIRALQQHLVDKGNLPQDVLTHTDSFPLPRQRLEQAVARPLDDFGNLAVLFAQPDEVLPLLREAYTRAESQEDRLMYAHVLGIMGDPSGAEMLAEAVAASDWDEGWKYTGMGQFGRSMSPVDSLIIALGRTRRDLALEPILAKVRQLGPEHAMSHHRAVAIALESLGDPAAAKPLVELLAKPGMTGHAYTDIEWVINNIPASSVDNSTRERSLRELILARALYRCGDYEGLAERVLNEYARDLRGHYVRHALAILSEKQ